MTRQSPRQRLYLVTPALEDPAAFVDVLEAALGAADIAALLVRLAETDERALINRAKTVTTLAQRRDVAVLLDGRPQFVGRIGADGAHIAGIEAFVAALATLKPERIAGAGGLRSRHDAMLAGEAGADYVMFGEPDRRGARPPQETVLDYLSWWAELFEIPCVGYAAAAEDVEPLAATGADFVALGEWIWTEPQGAAAAIAAAAAKLAGPR